jgi:nickel-dependent lactate racemase
MTTLAPTVPLVAIDPPLLTGAWYGDRPLALALPADWDLTIHWPRTPAAMTNDEVRSALDRPLDGASLTKLASGLGSVAIIVDDLTRPTPVDRILPLLLDDLAAAGIRDEAITIIVGTGTHGPSKAGVERKVGHPIAARYRVAFHDDRRDCVRIGTTSFGSPVLVNRDVAASDLTIGMGGIYPQHTVGFGGGAKTVLGALGRASIERLHYRHPSVDGRLDIPSDFRRDVAEMADLVGMRFVAAALVDARRELIWLAAGPPTVVHAAGVELAVEWFGAPGPGDADVVIANAFPMDTSATFARSKGVIPLTRAAPLASRVLIGAASEGVGHHGLFPLEAGRATALVDRVRVARNVPPASVAGLGIGLVRRSAERVISRRERAAPIGRTQRPILFHPTTDVGLPGLLAGMRTVTDWDELVRLVEHEQSERGQADRRPADRTSARRQPLRTVVYPCSPLQVLEG